MALSAKNIEEIYQRQNNLHGLFSELGEIVLDEFIGIKLIGEVERTEGKETYETLRDCLKSAFASSSDLEWVSVNKIIPNKFRAVMSLYFVWAGVFAYGEEQGHELWPHIFEGIGFRNDPLMAQTFGRMFVLCLIENNLETFKTVKTGLVFVTRILLHGLIPKRHIEKFIQDYLLESLSQPGGFYQSGHTLIDKWLTKKYFVPKPIERFLKFGQPVNIDIVERFLDMAKGWDEDAPIHWWEWSLPKYMVDAFHKCIKVSRIVIDKKHITARSIDKPYLFFDYTRENQPVIALPPQRLDSEGVIEISFRDLSNSGNEVMEANPLGNTLRWKDNSIFSEFKELTVGPSDYWQVNISNNKQSVIYQFPESDSGEEILLFIFNANSGKAIRLTGDRGLPDKIIVVFLKDATIEVSGGTFLSDPLELPEKWRDWQYTFCSVEEKGSLKYSGPDRNFEKVIEESFSFSCYDEETDQPVLITEHRAPYWLRCSDETPVILCPNGLYLHFSDRAYRFWRRAVGRFRRLDKPIDKTESIPFRLSDARKTENGYMVDIPGIDNIKPGVYDIYLRGAIGIEDFNLPFVFIPLVNFERIMSKENPYIAHHFLFEFSDEVILESFETANITKDSHQRKISIFLKEDTADAFCALKAFTQSARPIILLLARSDLRWVRHSESGPIEWPYWRTRPEVIPIQRFEEIKDSRTLIELDTDVSSNSMFKPKKTVSGKLKITLQGRKSENTQSTSLMSYEAPKYKRHFRTIWVIDLKQFSDQMKDIQNYQRAAISIDCDGVEKDLPLFILLRYPEYKNFKVQSLGVSQEYEKVLISWDKHPNEPLKNRLLRFYPSGNQEQYLFESIPDGQEPPLTISLKPVEEAKTWIAQIDLVQGRFHTSRFNQFISTHQTPWMRVPYDWCDWIEWAFSPSEECIESCVYNESSPENIDLKSIPWSYFLYLFHSGTGQESCRKIKTILGEKLLRTAIPLTKGSVWEVKSGLNTILTLQVVSSTVDSTERGLRCLENISPVQWCSLPKGIQIKLQMEQSCSYLGKAGTVWDLCHTSDDQKPLMTSETEGVLEIDYWIGDAIGDEKNGSIHPVMPLEKLWNNPPHFPLLDTVKRHDTIFIKEGEMPGSRNLLSKMKIDKETNEFAFDLVNRWEKWSTYDGVEPFFGRMINGRLEFSPMGSVTGALAFISRLMAAGIENSLFRTITVKSSAAESMESLVIDTYEFVKEFLPQSFLRDMILSEIILNWYERNTISSL